MGQQQLLLIVLGVIIVGIAVVVGINVFTASAAQSNRDAVIADLTNIAAMAQQYYRKPAALAGGGNTFTGFRMPALSSTPGDNTTTATKTPNGSYTLAVTPQSVTLTGLGTEIGNNGSAVVGATMVVGPIAITSTTINN
jgi:Tfp pilus assembly protein PilE